MKIGVVTIHDTSGNFGNKLQNYAVVKTYEKLGLECHTIATEGKSKRIKLFIYYLWRLIVKRESFWGRIVRLKNFDIFDQYLNYDTSLLKGKSLDSYDVFSIGSDQVWNPNFFIYDKKRKYYHFLSFAGEKKKVCFAPSIGLEQLPTQWKEWFKKYLMTFEYISVREKEGAKIIKELTGKDAEVLIDPTLMLDASEWTEVAKRPNGVEFDKPYMVVYFLGGRDDKIENDIKIYAKENNLSIYYLGDATQKNIYYAGPSEFLYFIQHSKLVVTDSFHGCVFSFLFDRPFLLYDRIGGHADMMSRQKTLFEKFDLKRKYVNSGLKNELLEHDYHAGKEKLALERKRVIDFLKKSLV